MYRQAKIHKINNKRFDTNYEIIFDTRGWYIKAIKKHDESYVYFPARFFNDSCELVYPYWFGWRLRVIMRMFGLTFEEFNHRGVHGFAKIKILRSF